MNRRHGFFLAIAIGLAAIAGTYAALQTTDLGAQAATLSEQQIAEADVRLDKQEAALRRAARKRPHAAPGAAGEGVRRSGGRERRRGACRGCTGTRSGVLERLVQLGPVRQLRAG
jgi:hypothetical protein